MARFRDHDDDDRDDRPRRRDEDGERRSSRRSSREDDEDRPRRRSSREYDDSSSAAKKVNVCGLIGLILGIPSLVVTFVPCCGWLALPGVITSLVLGIIGMVVAKGSNGRMGGGLAVASLVLGAIGLLVSIIWLVFFSVAAITAPTTPSGTPVSPSDPIAASVTAAELAKEFKDNEVAANNKYKGKVVEVTGKVKRVTDSGGILDINVELDGQLGTTVDCEFDSSSRSSVANMTVGSTVTIRGRCKGMIISIDLEDCIVMPGGPTKTPDAGSPTKVTAATLAKEFADNAVAAGTRYENKTVEVTGTVFATDLADADNQVVFLGQKGRDVECRFGKQNLKGQAAITTGRTVTVRGKCVGNDDGPVVIEDCTLVK